MPLLISDTAGNIEYKSFSLKKGEALDILSEVSGKDKRRGTVNQGKRHLLIKEITLGGEKKLVFAELDAIEKEYGDAFAKEVSALLDSAFTVPQKKSRVMRGTLARVLAETYKDEFLRLGISLDTRKRPDTKEIDVPVDALIFCLSLMLRAFAVKGAKITLDITESNGGAVFFVQSEGDFAGDAKLAVAMLKEAAAYQGFSAELVTQGEVKSILLYVTPTDIADYGFKAADEKYLYKVASLCKEII